MGIVIRDVGGSDSHIGSSAPVNSVKVGSLKTIELINRARFFRHVRHDYDRAEEVYRRIIDVDPTDLCGLRSYVDFLVKIRHDL